MKPATREQKGTVRDSAETLLGFGFKPDVLAQNFPLNCDAALIYKHMFGSNRRTPPHQRNITVKHIQSQLHDATKQRVQWQSEVRTQETHKMYHDRPDHKH